MREKLETIMESDYAQLIRKKMEAVYANTTSSGQDRGYEKEKRDREQRQAFIVSQCPSGSSGCGILLILSDLPE
jgi:hypothetical protein